MTLKVYGTPPEVDIGSGSNWGGYMVSLCTIGYQDFTPETWLDTLLSRDIQLVVDVRDIPISRKRGFSKRQLAERLAEVGLDYYHAKELGNPKSLRNALKEGLDFGVFAEQFRSLLANRAGALEEVAALAEEQRICLLCFEEDPNTCHRSLIAESLVAMAVDEIQLEHLRRADIH